MKRDGTEMLGVREYAEGYPVHVLHETPLGLDEPREMIEAINEGGHNSTLIDLLDLVAWLKERRPELLAPAAPTKGTTKP